MGVGPKNNLWAELIDNYAGKRGKLTVVLPVQALRQRGAAISSGLSWDATLEDLHRELSSGVSMSAVARADQLIIHLPREAIAIFERSAGRLESKSRRANHRKFF